MKSTKVGQGKEKNAFANLLEQSFSREQQIQPGRAVMASVTNVKDKEFIFISTEFGPGVVAREEFIDADGRLTVGPGEKVQLFFRGTENGENTFTTRPSGRMRSQVLESALEQRIPMKGRVTKKIKGGYEVEIGEVMAFCPASQLEDGVEGMVTTFLITEATERRVIASHRAWKDIEREKRRESMQGTLQVGDIVSGSVKSLQPFGAFVDLGGIEGLVPVSEMSFERIGHPSEVVKVGDEVRVKVQKLDWKENRISLSIKALLANPWQGTLPFQPGDIMEGTVDSVKPFGVFVKLTGNFTGLVPASETGIPRGKSFEKEFTKGAKIRVMIQDLDREREKISLSVRRVGDADAQKEFETYMKDQNDGGAGDVSAFGQALKQALSGETKKKKK
ncbi:MAG: S1 RNA-binding domain-containing protein [Spirochaetia bacterium]|nr:S1 RNA-binding domain-containing protein [Spirochaetia bacterium]